MVGLVARRRAVEAFYCCARSNGDGSGNRERWCDRRAGLLQAGRCGFANFFSQMLRPCQFRRPALPSDWEGASCYNALTLLLVRMRVLLLLFEFCKALRILVKWVQALACPLTLEL